MAIKRIRTITKAVEEILKQDPGCPISKNRLWHWCKSGKVKSTFEDGKFFVDLDDLERVINEMV